MKKVSRRSFIPSLGALLVLPTLTSISKKVDETNLPIYPKGLKKGATIGLCAPAGPSHDLTEIDGFKKFLIEKGFKVKEGKYIRKHLGYFTSTDAQRAEEFMELIEDSSIDAIFFTRGGWGCARLLDLLDYNIIQKNPKIILGFSDISSLLIAITHKTGLITFHGPNGNASWEQPSYQWIEKLLFSENSVLFEAKGMLTNIQKTIISGIAEGVLIGGNLSVLCGIIGSKYVPSWENKILFLEEVAEEPYRVDRMLTQLKLNGVFDQLSGVVLGQFKKCIAEEPNWAFTVEEVLEQHFGNLKIPVFSNAPVGHVKDKYILPIGQKVQIDADKFTIRTLSKSVII
jgi:muramoyltetrapeptide carboxypeptidase